MKNATLALLPTFMLGSLGLSCAYAPALEKTVSNQARKLAIMPVEDKAGQPLMAQLLTEKATQAFVANGRLKVSPRDEADLVLQWSLQRYDTIVMLRDANQAPVRNRVQMMVDVDLFDAAGKLLMTTRSIINLTPMPSPIVTSIVPDSYANTATDEAVDWDSADVRTLKEYTGYTLVNSLGLQPSDEGVAQRRLADRMAQRVVELIINGDSVPIPHSRAQPTPQPTGY